MTQNDSQRIRELEQEIKHHRNLYYNDDAEISDAAYDALEDELRDLDPENSILGGVGALPDANGWDKRTHSYLMGSLNKARDYGEFSKWAEGQPSESFAWSEKMDGISLALDYRSGKLESAVTRGDGHIGEDILANAVLFRNVPRKIARDRDFVVRGEVVLPIDDWRNHLSDYSNPRNACAGIARTESRDEASQKCPYLSFYAYELLSDEPMWSDEQEKYLILDDMGFHTPNHGVGLKGDEIDELRRRYVDELRSDLLYEIDGLVVRLSDREAFERSGVTSGRPNAAVAYKFPNKGAVSTLTDVSWEMGNTGRITPVAEFDHVRIVGAEVWRASLYNPDYVDELELCVGDRILVERANDVIPRVVEVVESRGGDRVEAPTECPECAGPTERDGSYLVCASEDCGSRILGALRRWIESTGVLGWGDSILENLVEAGLVLSPSDFYQLSVQDLAPLENSGGAKLGRKRAQQLLERMEEAKKLQPQQFLGGLNVSMLRESTAATLIDQVGDVEAVMKMTAEELASLNGIGEAKAEAIAEGLQDRRDLINELRAVGVSVVAPTDEVDGLRFCLTGRMSKKRSEIESMIMEKGGRVGGVTSDLDYLVTNNPDSNSGKAKKARKLDVEFIDENALYEMLGVS